MLDLADATGGLVIKNYKHIVLSPDDTETQNLRLWSLRKTENIRINLVEFSGELALHKHPDAAHTLIILEGTVKVLAGDQQEILEKGDFISIPAEMPHKYWSLSPRATMVSMDAPYYDPRKTVVLE